MCFRVFAVESPTTTTKTTATTKRSTSTEIQAVTKLTTHPTTKLTSPTTELTQLPTTAVPEETEISPVGGKSVTHLPPGIPIPNTSQNFTFKYVVNHLDITIPWCLVLKILKIKK